MREILFRGKRIDNGEWVEGSFVNLWMVNYKKYQPLITDNKAISYEIDPETIGQYTGLTDKNGKRIFEGDIVRLYGGEEYEWVAKVGMKSGCWVVFSENDWDFLAVNIKPCEVIGNTHDNPELLRGECT